MRNKYGIGEWSGAFGDLGTLIPFVVGYIAIVGMNPTGVLVTLGVFMIVVGLHFKTPFPVQPMKAIGAAAIAQAGAIGPNAIWSAGLFTGLFWLILGLSGALKWVAKIAGKPIIRGITLGLGISFIIQAISFMRADILVAALSLVLAFALLGRRIPAMLVLLLFGFIVTGITNDNFWQELSGVHVDFSLPSFALGELFGELSRQDLLTGVFILAIPQIPLTLGNAVIATTAENNRHFPDHPVSEKKVAVFKGVMNLIAPIFGGIPLCHGAGGMAAHMRFGAKTGGALVIIGGLLLILGLFFGSSVLIIFSMLPLSVLGVILFFAGLELAISVRDIGPNKADFYILLITAGFALWNVGIGFLAGLITQELTKRRWLRL
jgi:hypothetical protein